MIIWILKIACVASPKRSRCALDYFCSSSLRLIHDRMDFRLCIDVVADGHFSGARWSLSDPCVMRNRIARPKCQLETRLQIKKSNGAMLKLFADDSFGL